MLAYPQAKLKRPVYMELPCGFKFENLKGLQRNKHCLEVTQNLYGGKESGQVWYLHLRKQLEEIGFEALEHDEFVFF